ncbi:MAG: hypothetical protein IPN71_17460 [Fibrobacteres bacterium]|jgi:hypothetical protein|nr:hypothetical protein [Fibrobacterota bacterium]
MILSSVFPLILAAFGNENMIEHGFDARVGYDPISVGENVGGKGSGASSDGGISVTVGPNLWIPIQGDWAVDASLLANWKMFSVEHRVFNGNATQDFSLLTVGLQACAGYLVTDGLAAKLGVELDIPVGGSVDVSSPGKSQSFDLVWAPGIITDYDEKNEIPLISTNNLVGGLSYQFRDDLQVTLQGKFAVNGIIPSYDGTSLDGANNAPENIKLHQVQMGVSYRFHI